MKSFNEVALVALEAKINRYLCYAGQHYLNNGIEFKSVVSEEIDSGSYGMKVKLQVTHKSIVIYSEWMWYDPTDKFFKIDKICNHLEEHFVMHAFGYFLNMMIKADEVTRAVACLSGVKIKPEMK